MKIYIIGLGAGNTEYLGEKAYNLLISNKMPVFLRTIEHKTVQYLEEKGMKYEALDRFYKEESFEKVYEEISSYIISKAKKEDIIYAVPGNPALAEKTTILIKEKAKDENIDVELVPSTGYIEAIAIFLMDELKIDISKGTIISDTTILDTKDLNTDYNILISQVYDKYVASDLKLKLMEVYDDEEEIFVMKSIGNKDSEIINISLYEMDRIDYDHLTSIFIKKTKRKKYNKITDVIEKLLEKNDTDSYKNIDTKDIVEKIKKVSSDINSDDIENIIEKSAEILKYISLITVLEKEQNALDISEIIDRTYQNI